MSAPWEGVLNKIDDYRWEIPTGYKSGMRVPGLIYASESLLSHIWEENAFEQVANVAFLPGIVGHSLAMPDIHWGYGFPIGGVAATRLDDGVVTRFQQHSEGGDNGFLFQLCTRAQHPFGFQNSEQCYRHRFSRYQGFINDPFGAFRLYRIIPQ